MTDAELETQSSPHRKYRERLLRRHGLDNDARPTPCWDKAPLPMGIGTRCRLRRLAIKRGKAG